MAAKREFRTTPRGFKVYGEVEDSRTCIVRVQESSAAGRPHAYLYTDDVNLVYSDGKPVPHLSVDQAKALIGALEAFIADAGAPDNWRNDPEYIEAWG